MISDLKHLNRSHKQMYGSKAANLGELQQHGILTPAGFALSFEVFAEFMRHNHFPYAHEEYLLHPEQISDWFLAGEFPPAIHAELHAYYQSLCAGGDHIQADRLLPSI